MFQTDNLKSRPRFFELIDQLYSLLTPHGIDRPVPSTDVVAIFNALSPSFQKEIEARVQSQLDLAVHVLSIADREGFDALNDRRSTWASFRFLKLRPPSSLFSAIEDGDIVEMYDFNGIQIFRNFNFLKFTSYSLEDIFLNSFEALYDRDEAITAQLWKTTERVMTIDGPVAVGVKAHDFTERVSRTMRKCHIEFKIMSPIYGSDTSDSPIAILFTSRAHILGA